MVIGQMYFPMERIGALCRKYRIKELSLFGSALRDDFHNDSDVDLLVDFYDVHHLDLVDFIQIKEALSVMLGRRVDLVDKVGIKSTLRGAILESSQVLFAE